MKFKSILNPFIREGSKRKGKLDFGNFSKPEFEYLQNNLWVLNEKIDGTNIRIAFDGDSVEIDGRTDNAEIPNGLHDLLISLFETNSLKSAFPKITKDLNESVILYGEGIGEGINGNAHRISGYDFVLFDVLVGTYWLSQKNIEDIAYKLNLKHSPVVGEYHLEEAFLMVSKGFKSNFGGDAEGVIAKPKIPLSDRCGDRIITKIRYDDFKHWSKNER